MQQIETFTGRAGAGLNGLRPSAGTSTGLSAGLSTGLTSMGLDPAATIDGMDRHRQEGIEETLATLSTGSESLRGIAHDARNMVTALGLYCELLEEPGVLSAPFAHYGSELRLVVTASRRLVEKLVALDAPRNIDSVMASSVLAGSVPQKRAAGKSTARTRQEKAGRWEMVPAQPLDNLAADLLANRKLLAALAGPAVKVTVEAQGGKQPVRLTCEDLTRILVNLVKNAAEAISAGGNIHLSLRESASEDGGLLTLIVEDDGPGIPAQALHRIFESGYTTRCAGASGEGVWPATHRGLGLSITRSILESAGGKIHAANRAQGGARFEIELPVRPG